MYNTSLQHHGILGQKWGVRRYQNPDGSLTKAGKRKLEKDQAKMEKVDKKWIDKNYNKIYSKAYKASSKDLQDYVNNELRPKYAGQELGKKTYANDFNKKYAELMNKAVKDVEAPSGRIVQFVAKRGEIGVYMALADKGYDMSNVKNGVYSSGRIAYKQSSVEKS